MIEAKDVLLLYTASMWLMFGATIVNPLAAISILLGLSGLCFVWVVLL